MRIRLSAGMLALTDILMVPSEPNIMYIRGVPSSSCAIWFLPIACSDLKPTGSPDTTVYSLPFTNAISAYGNQKAYEFPILKILVWENPLAIVNICRRDEKQLTERNMHMEIRARP